MVAKFTVPLPSIFIWQVSFCTLAVKFTLVSAYSVALNRAVASPENNVASVGSRKRLIGITITGK
ncbi:Uncharacterised protein [Salmonella enterica subsp. enterica serovar Typhi]|nr:Uncharacterised protein [Salmonella enterica subsp. enterica serovar Typhi]